MSDEVKTMCEVKVHARCDIVSWWNSMPVEGGVKSFVRWLEAAPEGTMLRGPKNPRLTWVQDKGRKGWVRSGGAWGKPAETMVGFAPLSLMLPHQEASPVFEDFSDE